MRRFFSTAAVALMLATAPAAGREPSRVMAFAGELPPRMETGDEISVPVLVTNHGEETWSSEDGIFVSYHWFDADGARVEWDGRRSPFSGPVAPGETVEVVAAVAAPGVSGRLYLQWDVVHEGVRWFSELEPVPQPKQLVVVSSSHAFAVGEAGLPGIVWAGRTARIDVELRNDGPRAWRGDGSFAVAPRWYGGREEGVHRIGHDVAFEGRRATIPRRVDPGESIRLIMDLEVPSAGGRHELRWDMVEEGVCWFSERGGADSRSATVLVLTSPLTDARWWALLCLLAAAAAVSTVRLGGSGPLVSLFASAELLWCVGSLTVKQGVVLAEGGARVTGGGWFLIIASAVAAVAVVALVMPNRRGWACWILVALGTFVLWSDAVYLRFFGDLPSVAAASSLGQLGEVEASIWSLTPRRDLWLWLDLLPAVALVLVAKRLRPKASGAPSGWRLVVAGALAVALLSGAALAVVGGALDQVFRRVLVAQEVGVLNLHAMDLVQTVSGRLRRGELGDDERQAVLDWFQRSRPSRAGVGPAFAAGAGANLVMLQVESLQTFVIGLEVGGREVTPFLNRWRREALWFSNVTDQSLAGRSSDSEFATQVSLLPSARGAAAFNFADNRFTGLASVLRASGYDTVSAVAYDGTFWNRSRTHPAYGYESSLFDGDFETGEQIGWGLNDHDFLSQMAGRMRQWPQPWAAYLLTLSLHHPFEGFPPQHRELDVGRWQGTPFGAYLHTMHFFDRALAKFMDELQAAGLAETTVVAIWGDHDAGFEWRREIAAAMGAVHDEVGWYLSQEVPLFIRMPGRDDLRGERLQPAGHVDVAPTLLALLGIDPATYAFVGRNLLGEPGDDPVIGEYECWRDTGHLFLQRDGTLANGRCLVFPNLDEVRVDACGDGFERARAQREASRLVLEHDLQPWLHRQLAESVEAAE